MNTQEALNLQLDEICGYLHAKASSLRETKDFTNALILELLADSLWDHFHEKEGNS